MSSKSQRKKERHAKKRKEKQKEKARQELPQKGTDITVGNNERHRQQLALQVPHAWPGELPEDVAVFDDAVLATLTPELAQQVVAVRDALSDASESRGEEALKRLSVISHSSPLSDWRLFVRGLVDWLAGNTEAASEAWKRLNSERRPGRISTVMMAALRSDLDHDSTPENQASAPENAGQQSGQSETTSPADVRIIFHAKLLRRVRIDRTALRIAEAGLSEREEDPELLLGPRKLQWLSRFIAEYRDTEPALTSAMAQAALRRSFEQTYSDIFDKASRFFAGPRHDPLNRLLTFFYYGRFKNDPAADRKAQAALDEYLKRSLIQNNDIPTALRDAIRSQIHLNEAMVFMQPQGEFAFIETVMERMNASNSPTIRKHLVASQDAYPANAAAYKVHAGWIGSKLNSEWLDKGEEARLNDEMTELMQRWSKAMPDEVEPRLWLVDLLLENERLDEARPHVEFLSASRQEDPQVRATPWKWQLLEARRLCRRKAWLTQAALPLEEAEKLWPAWLSKDWLPYLKAALTLRSGQMEAFKQQREQILLQSGRSEDSLADACMMLGAAQHMRVPAGELGPLRASLDRALKQIGKLPLEDLFETGSFFWDLHRTRLVYPAYRNHGKNIGLELLKRLEKNPKLVVDRIDEQPLQGALFWASEHQYWSKGIIANVPLFFGSPKIANHPLVVAAKVNAFLNQRFQWGSREYVPFGSKLREFAQQHRDAYYRYWFDRLANRLDDALARQAAQFGTRFFDGPGEGGFNENDDDDFDDEDDDLSYDPDCNCPDCKRARAREAERERQQQLPF